MRILALDPGTQIVGWAAVDTTDNWPPTLIDSGIIEPGGRTLYARLASIAQKVIRLRKKFRPIEVAVEGGYVGFGKNRNPPAQLTLAEARGVIIVAAAGTTRPVAVYSPLTVKKAATGNHHADKELVIDCVAQIFQLVGLPYSDEADALAIALCHAKVLKEQTP